jgi:hypothetical protein
MGVLLTSSGRKISRKLPETSVGEMHSLGDTGWTKYDEATFNGVTLNSTKSLHGSKSSKI